MTLTALRRECPREEFVKRLRSRKVDAAAPVVFVARAAASASVGLAVLAMACPARADGAEAPQVGPAPEVESGVLKLSVARVLRRVEEAHPKLRARAAERVQAEIALRRARWDRVRGLAGARAGYAAGAERTGGPPAFSSTDHHAAAQAFADVRVPLFAGGAIEGAIEAAASRTEAARADERLAVEELKRTALLAYANLVASTSALAVAERASARAQALVQLAERRRDAGAGAEADVARGRLNLVRREEERVSAAGDVEIAEAVLRAALALGDSLRVAVDEPLDAVAQLQAPPGLERRWPEVQAARARVGAAESDVTVARAGYLPTIALFAGGQYGSGVFGGTPGGLSVAPAPGPGVDPTMPASGAAIGGAVLTWTAFDMFVTRDRVATAEQAVAASRAELADAQRVVFGNRNEASARRAQAEARVRVLASGASVAADAVRLARARYEAGTGIFTDAIEAELDSIALEARRVQASLDLALAHVDWLRAEGISLGASR